MLSATQSLPRCTSITTTRAVTRRIKRAADASVRCCVVDVTICLGWRTMMYDYCIR